MDRDTQRFGKQPPRTALSDEPPTTERSDISHQTLGQSRALLPPRAEACTVALTPTQLKSRPAAKRLSGTLVSLKTNHNYRGKYGTGAASKVSGRGRAFPKSTPVTEGIAAPDKGNHLRQLPQRGQEGPRN